MSRSTSLATRWLGVGLAAVLAVVTIGLAVTGAIDLYINPDSVLFAVTMAVLVLVGAIASFLLPLGTEADHGHAHGMDADHGHAHGTDDGHDHTGGLEPGRSRPLALAATIAGGAAASGIVLLALATPPAALSTEFAMSRDVGTPPLFAGADAVTLAATGDTSEFGVGEWASVFATATDTEAFDGDPVVLTGFVTTGGVDFQLSRLVVTHCVIDAQTASLPIAWAEGGTPATGQWVTITGTVRSTTDGRLGVDATTVEEISEPEDPYEY